MTLQLWRGWSVLIGGCLAASTALADALPQADALNWLQRIATAARQLNYAGTFVYQQGDTVETSRIVHVMDGTNEIERLETLDGPRREVVRNNEIVFTYHPDSKSFRVDRRRPRRTFPQILPDQLTAVTDHYHVKKADVERVADHDAQTLILEPKDSMRYGHKFWADANTGLLLKAKMIGERGQVIEQFAFTQVQIGGQISRQLLQPSMPLPAPGPSQDASQESAAAESEWVIKSPPAGFRKIVEVRRAKDSAPPAYVTHMVLSDGLAAISVFIEPARQKVAEGLVQRGAINIYTRVLGDQRITVLGEAPAVTVVTIANALTPRSRQP
ncbi:MAG: MucB/RseB C-terminal domain-containing protein [Betaproteobacteria bacterium]|nr:MucB/RseB C-terminal domain-containing protein [Betaproteobacteria bacterium]